MSLYLSGTEGVSGINGTNTTPANRGSDTNTGIVYGTDTVQIATGGTTAVTVDSSQNVGIGVTPSTWSLGKAIEINTVGNSVWATSTAYVMGNNFYYNGGYKFAGTGYATSYIQSTGAHVWNVSTASGTAGNAITFTQAMTLDSSGNLAVGGAGGSNIRLYSKGVDSTSANFAMYIENSSGTGIFQLRNDGVFKAPPTYSNTVGATNRALYIDNSGIVGYVSSLRETKTNIEPLSNVSWLYSLEPVSFNYRKKDEAGTYTDEVDGGEQYGCIAEDVETVNSEVCYFGNDGKLEGVNYQKLIVPMLKAIQELSAKLDAAEARIAALEAK